MTNVKCPNETFLNVIFFPFEKFVQKKKEVFYELIIESKQKQLYRVSLYGRWDFLKPDQNYGKIIII